MLIRAPLRSGVTSAALAVALMALMFAAWDQLQLVWPMVFVPLFVTDASGRKDHHAGGASLVVANRSP